MPFRLLGMVADPGHASALCGHTFGRYAASGVDITLACAMADHWPAGRVDVIRALGVRSVMSLGFEADEIETADLDAVVADVLTGIRPHVVVADGLRTPMARAAVAVFHRVRRGGGSSVLPARLYARASTEAAAQVTTRIACGTHAPEYFTRIYPAPWVTGVVETDLFAGLRDSPFDMPERLAS